MKTAVITGGTRGIGKEIVNLFIREGYKVIVLSASGAQVEGAESYKCNVADFNAVKQIAEKIGAVDVLVNNAGITKDNLALRMTESEFDEVINTNLKGVFNCCKHFMRAIIKSGGRIINISSVSGICGNVGQANYAASKAGVIALTKTLARELGGKGVTVNAVAPGFIETDMTGALSDEIKQQILNRTVIKRFGTPEDIAKAVLFLVNSPYITGQVLVVDGGLSM